MTMIDFLTTHYPTGEFPFSVGRKQLMLTVGLMESALVLPARTHEGAIEELLGRARNLGLEPSPTSNPDYQDINFLYERRIALEEVPDPMGGPAIELSRAQILLARGFDTGEYHTFFSATILSHADKAGIYRFTTAFIPSTRFMHDRMEPGEAPFNSSLRPYVSGTIVPRAHNFMVALDMQNTSFNAIGCFKIMMKKIDLSRRPAVKHDINQITPQTTVHEWLRHFAVAAPTKISGSPFYKHFPRPQHFLLDLR